jgi:phosphatidylglycerol---prolipoprotein diacylglyceryl transferase
MTLAAWLHDWSPWVLRLTPTLGIRWYGLSYVLGFVLGGAALWFLAKRRVIAIHSDRIPDLILWAVVGVMAGGRLGYAVFYDPKLLTTFTTDVPFWDLLRFNKGGMASHGGMIGVIVAVCYAAKRFVDPALLPPDQKPGLATIGQRIRHTLDAMALAVPIGMFLGRVANFVNGELLGEIITKPAVMGGPAAPAYAVRFPQELTDEYLRFEGVIADRPSTLGEAQWRDLATIIDRAGFATPGQHLPAIVDGAMDRASVTGQERARQIGPLLDAIERAIDHIQHGGASLATQIEPYIAARHPSQLYQALAEGIVMGAILWLLARSPRLPGVIGASFLITYGVLRVITEFWRLPDAQLAVQRIAGLSRGQLLSVAMVLAGVVAIIIVKQWGGTRVGGWAKRA